MNFSINHRPSESAITSPKEFPKVFLHKIKKKAKNIYEDILEKMSEESLAEISRNKLQN